jgi:hypothetical protein
MERNPRRMILNESYINRLLNVHSLNVNFCMCVVTSGSGVQGDFFVEYWTFTFHVTPKHDKEKFLNIIFRLI